MKNILISGVSRGLGLELTRFFLEKGNRVYGFSRMHNDEIACLEKNYQNAFVWFPLDLSELTNIETTLEQFVPRKSVCLDAFINNAAILYKDLVHRLDASSYATMMTVNAIAPAVVSKMVLRNFLYHKTPGSMVHISSICAHRSFNGLSMMGASKAAVESFSRDVAYEYGRFGIRSNTIVVGLMDIGMKSSVNSVLTNGLQSISSLRKLVDYHSVLSMADFLISDQSCCITGENMHIDAGIL